MGSVIVGSGLVVGRRDGQTGGGAMFVECINDRRFPCTFHRDEPQPASQPVGFADFTGKYGLYLQRVHEDKNCCIYWRYSEWRMAVASENAAGGGSGLTVWKLFITCENNSLLGSNANNATYVLVEYSNARR